MSYGAFAQYYDALTENVDYPEKARFISTVLNKHKPGCTLVVDLACGTGTLSLALAEMGFDMIAVDGSYEMLSVASMKENTGVMFLCQQLDELDLYGTVDAMICTLDSVNHITDEQTLREVFRRVALFLEPDGVFLFDANTEYKHRCVLGDNAFVYDLDEVYCVWQNHLQEDGSVEISLDFFEPDGDGAYWRSSESFVERVYSRSQLSDMLDSARLVIAEEYDDYTDSSPSPECQRVVYVCRRKGN